MCLDNNYTNLTHVNCFDIILYMKQSERVERTKKTISLALYALLLRKPYEEITVSDICRKADISRVSFYHYYDKKDDILIQFSDERFAEFFDDFTKLESMTLEDLVVEMFRFLKKNSRQLAILRYAKKEDILLEQFHSYGRYIFSNNRTSNLLQKNRNNQFLLPFLVGGLFQVIMRWLDQGMSAPPEEVAKSVFEIIQGPNQAN